MVVRDVLFSVAQQFGLDTNAGTTQERRLRKEGAGSPLVVKSLKRNRL